MSMGEAAEAEVGREAGQRKAEDEASLPSLEKGIRTDFFSRLSSLFSSSQIYVLAERKGICAREGPMDGESERDAHSRAHFYL